ncbi:ABC transporter substrate-binding protein [Oryzicola mucosus]|uniref:ABC transporter substrate-binding protein n=1 Tax=Oryzicola mucosus TaxID=2767425 RepID=A0A8J6U851_9HYPH|nr:ABC transporter substrate-binding protein [Oryzicola mucosus]MBD0415362.1 ABC transporter substrate-binding protein [Oryzicola mucosus]
MKKSLKIWAASALSLTLMAGSALADITIGVTIPTTGPGAALGIPLKNSIELWPTEIAGEKLKVIILDDAGDPSAATTNARRFANDDKVDVLMGSALTPAAIGAAGVAAEVGVPHFAISPVPPQVAKGKWSFVLPQYSTVLAKRMFARMQKDGVKRVSFIGFADSYGQQWVDELTKTGKDFGLEVVADERYARADTSVSGQVLKALAAKPDAVFIGASGTGAALPQIGVRERGFTGPVYVVSGAVTFEFLRIAGKAVENTIFSSGPVMVAEDQADDSPTKAEGLAYLKAYEGKFGPNTRTQFGSHVWDAMVILQKAVPVALKTAKPGTQEFRDALRDAIESSGPYNATHGVFQFTPEDHYGLDERGAVLLTAKDGKFMMLKD